MYFLYLLDVLKRAFTPAPRVTDMLQILAASALPAASKFVGLHLPQDASENALAYIGLVAISFVVIRLFWAPYAIWKEQNGEIGGLKLELSKPQRLENERMAAARAQAKAELTGVLPRMIVLSIRREPGDHSSLQRHIEQALELCGRANASLSFDEGIDRFGHRCLDIVRSREPLTNEWTQLAAYVNPMQAYLHGEITGEDLALRLPASIARKKRP